jgi:hypothetical protein
MHCKDTMPKIRNKCSQERNCAGLSPNFLINVSVRDLNIATINLPMLLQENMWTDLGNIFVLFRIFVMLIVRCLIVFSTSFV